MACADQKSTLSLYLTGSKSTPDPPSSLPSAFLIIVIGFIGPSKS